MHRGHYEGCILFIWSDLHLRFRSQRTLQDKAYNPRIRNFRQLVDSTTYAQYDAEGDSLLPGSHPQPNSGRNSPHCTSTPQAGATPPQASLKSMQQLPYTWHKSLPADSSHRIIPVREKGGGGQYPVLKVHKGGCRHLTLAWGIRLEPILASANARVATADFDDRVLSISENECTSLSFSRGTITQVYEQPQIPATLTLSQSHRSSPGSSCIARCIRKLQPQRFRT